MIAASTLPATIASRYLPVRIIGRGGMGVVYEVVHARTGEHLALKILQGSAGAPAEALARFKREARAPAQIKSENVVHVSDADVAPELDGAPFLVMELLEGVDLEQAASISKPDPATAVGWLRQIAPALDKAHRLGIIHRDLKPENLFLATLEGRPAVVKILDFGVAKMAEEGTASTVSGQVLGTPKYMAPEQADRNPRVTPAADRYALGLIAYRLIVGESYYRGAVMSILAELLHGTITAPSARDPTLGEAFDAWFMKACHREPARRFASASEQVEALAEALGLPFSSGDALAESRSSSLLGPHGDPGLAPATSSYRAPSVGASTRRTLVAAGLVLVASAAVFAYRASNTKQIGASATPSTPVATRVDPAAPRREIAPVVDALPATSAPTLAPAPDAAPRPSASHAPVRVRARAPRADTLAPASKAPPPDPFRDQK